MEILRLRFGRLDSRRFAANDAFSKLLKRSYLSNCIKNDTCPLKASVFFPNHFRARVYCLRMNSRFSIHLRSTRNFTAKLSLDQGRGDTAMKSERPGSERPVSNLIGEREHLAR